MRGCRRSGHLLKLVLRLAPVNSREQSCVFHFDKWAKDGRQTDDIDRSVRVLSCSQEVVVTGLAEGIDTGRDQDYRFAPAHGSHLPQGEDNSVV
jgi:hypothetical protein